MRNIIQLIVSILLIIVVQTTPVSADRYDVLFERFEIDDISITYEYPTYHRTVIAKTSLRELTLLEDLSELKQED